MPRVIFKIGDFVCGTHKYNVTNSKSILQIIRFGRGYHRIEVEVLVIKSGSDTVSSVGQHFDIDYRDLKLLSKLQRMLLEMSKDDTSI